jgi:dTMP kinase
MGFRRGTFIVIEGTDGSGKATQAKLLEDRLRAEGYPVATFDFPQYDQPSSYFVKQYLNGRYGTADQVGPYTASLFYALDRFEAGPQIRAALDEGKVVLANRFVGSNMAHQGTKFRNPDERRGYFIWNDNLEFEVLQLPRPDVSFVLRVPADIAWQLIGQKEQRSYTDKKRDLHEADQTHLERAVAVYDDLTQLFPKDFQRIDCVRGNNLLPIETIQELIWQKVKPMLPEPQTVKFEPVQATNVPLAPHIETAQAEPQPAASRPGMPISILVAAKMEHSAGDGPFSYHDYDQKDEQGRYKYFTPAHLPPDVQRVYQAKLDQIFSNYAQMITTLSNYLSEQEATPAAERASDWQRAVYTRACEVLHPVLPLAALTTPPAHVSEDRLAELWSDPLPEAQTLSAQLLAAMQLAERREAIAAATAYAAATRQGVAALAKQHLAGKYAAEPQPLQLATVWPRNEFDLLADMLYEHANLPLLALQTEVQTWSYNQKLDVFEAYIGARLTRHDVPGSALEKAQYGWDAVSDFATYRDVRHTCRVYAAAQQEPTPRYGFAVPKEVEDAGMSDLYEQCFDISLELHSLMQKAGHSDEAPYATLLGHRLRWKITYNAREAFRLHEQRRGHGNSGYQQLLTRMHEKIAEVHPLLAESMKFAGKGDDPQLARRAVDRLSLFTRQQAPAPHQIAEPVQPEAQLPQPADPKPQLPPAAPPAK